MSGALRFVVPDWEEEFRACLYTTRWLISQNERKSRSGFFTKTADASGLKATELS